MHALNNLKDDAESQGQPDFHLKIVDYRYTRFVLNPGTGLYNMIRLVFYDKLGRHWAPIFTENILPLQRLARPILEDYG